MSDRIPEENAWPLSDVDERNSELSVSAPGIPSDWKCFIVLKSMNSYLESIKGRILLKNGSNFILLKASY